MPFLPIILGFIWAIPVNKFLKTLKTFDPRLLRIPCSFVTQECSVVFRVRDPIFEIYSLPISFSSETSTGTPELRFLIKLSSVIGLGILAIFRRQILSSIGGAL